uniref:Uncharacterized protein n=1 Tax=uncultured organism MedDCM-OCT-S04-C777 TaxID=743619 RepID=D6PK96_9ZZZZ|nr:hypothetical protein [uncultured organism MedDCM-OCT-S04-C777]
MKALIFENKVVDVQATEFEVAPTMSWVDCDDTVKIGFSYDGSTFTSDEPTAEEIATLEAERQAKANLKASAKAKLIAGEALTEERERGCLRKKS